MDQQAVAAARQAAAARPPAWCSWWRFATRRGSRWRPPGSSSRSGRGCARLQGCKQMSTPAWRGSARSSGASGSGSSSWRRGGAPWTSGRGALMQHAATGRRGHRGRSATCASRWEACRSGAARSGGPLVLTRLRRATKAARPAGRRGQQLSMTAQGCGSRHGRERRLMQLMARQGLRTAAAGPAQGPSGVGQRQAQLAGAAAKALRTQRAAPKGVAAASGTATSRHGMGPLRGTNSPGIIKEIRASSSATRGQRSSFLCGCGHRRGP